MPSAHQWPLLDPGPGRAIPDSHKRPNGAVVYGRASTTQTAVETRNLTSARSPVPVTVPAPSRPILGSGPHYTSHLKLPPSLPPVHIVDSSVSPEIPIPAVHIPVPCPALVRSHRPIASETHIQMFRASESRPVYWELHRDPPGGIRRPRLDPGRPRPANAGPGPSGPCQCCIQCQPGAHDSRQGTGTGDRSGRERP